MFRLMQTPTVGANLFSIRSSERAPIPPHPNKNQQHQILKPRPRCDRARRHTQLECRAEAAQSSDNAPSVALEGDLVTLHFTVFGEQGERLESSRDAGQPLTFEVGSSDAVGNELLQAFDGGVRGLAVGGLRRIELAPLQSEWKKELLFTIPRDHPEVQRLEGKFRSSGGLSEGMIVELVNGQQAQVLKTMPDSLVLDANHAMAGRKIAFEIELVGLEREGS